MLDRPVVAARGDDEAALGRRGVQRLRVLDGHDLVALGVEQEQAGAEGDGDTSSAFRLA